MNIVTKNDVSARGKQSVLLLMDNQDKEKYYDTIVDDVLSVVNCAIYSIEMGEDVDVKKFVASILIVSENLIDNKKDNYEIFQKLITNNIPIIPIAVQSGIRSGFSKEFGKQQCIFREDENTLDVYRKTLGNRLREIIVSDNIVSDIEKLAFNCNVFLSYRKCDAEKAKQVIGFLRQHKRFREAAIWYDNYIIPGNNYENEIVEEIKNCDFFVLVITKNITEKSKNAESGSLQDNYVLRVEYPLALQFNKPIIPIIVDKLDEDTITEKFEDIGDMIHYGKQYELEKKIKKLSISLNHQDTKDLYFQYLRGVAFLNGIFTEVDVKKGVKILKSAADSGQKDAIVKIAKMYYDGDRLAKNCQYSACYYKKLIDEVENTGSITKYPYCYNNYACALGMENSSDKGYSNIDYSELIEIFEKGISVLRENRIEDKEYLFYFALTLASYQKVIFQAIYDERLTNPEDEYQKCDMAIKESISILDKLIDEDALEVKYKRLKVTLEKEMAEKASLPEFHYMYSKLNLEYEKETTDVIKMYTTAIADMKILYDLNPLETEEEYIELLFQASQEILLFDNNSILRTWMEECLNICELATRGKIDDASSKILDFYRINARFFLDYISLDFLSFIKKYNECIKNEEYIELDIRNMVFAIETNYLSNNSSIPDEIYHEIQNTIMIAKNNKLRDNEHCAYVGLNLEYAYKGDLDKEAITPDDYFRVCNNYRFQASLEQRGFLGNRMVNIAKELCEKGIGYNSALNCLNSACEVLAEIVRKNPCYYGDLKVAFSMKDTLEKCMPILKDNPKLRLQFIPEEIAAEGEGTYMVEIE